MPFLRKFLNFSCGVTPPNPSPLPAPERNVSSEKRKSFEVRVGEGFRKEGGEGKKEGKKDAQKVPDKGNQQG